MPSGVHSRRGFIACLIIAFSAALTTHRAAAAKRYERLFWIERSTNANIVAYDAVLEGERIDASSPVVGYWVNKATNGATESLSALDKMAYGYSVKRDRGPAESFL